MKILESETHKDKANLIRQIIDNLNYRLYGSTELEAIILLTNHVRHIPPEEINNFRLVKYSEAWHIYKRLKKAYSLQNVSQEMEILLTEYEQFELLSELTKI